VRVWIAQLPAFVAQLEPSFRLPVFGNGPYVEPDQSDAEGFLPAAQPALKISTWTSSDMNWRVSGRTPPTRTASSSRSRRGVSFYRRGSVGAVLARRIYLGSDAYSDARGLYWLRGNRADLQVDCSAAHRSNRQNSWKCATAASSWVTSDRHTALPRRVITLLGDARRRGEKPTPLSTTSRGFAKEHRAHHDHHRRCHPYPHPNDPTIGQRRIWDIWIDHVRDAD
jgi:hypothetical protein